MTTMMSINFKNNENISLIDILQCMSEGWRSRDWSILDLEATGDVGEEFPFQAIHDAFQNKNEGYVLAFNDLEKLTGKFRDLIRIFLIAADDKNSFVKSTKTFEDVLKNYPLAIALEDGGYWEIYTNDEKIITEFSKKYNVTLQEL